jgi:FtsP/CotA-like multicopper oxidase with cupredoxin domain
MNIVKGIPMSDQTVKREVSGTILLAMMLAVIAAVILVLGALGVTAIAKGDAGTSTSQATTTVHVTLSEFKIALDPPTVPAGHVILEIHNTGTAEHNVAVKSLNKRTANILSMGTATLDLGVVSGPIEVVCEISGHLESGMRSSLGIGAISGATATTVAPMTPEEMDKMMKDVALQFPAKTTGTGNEELAFTKTADGYKVFNLTASVIDWEVEPGKFVKGWAYNKQIPGPIIRVNVGDKVRINVKNELAESTALHMHGVRVPNWADGVDPYTQEAIKTGETMAYDFTVLEPGVGMYHSHHNAQVQVPNGLAGALIAGDWKLMAMEAANGKVDDADGKAEQENVIVLNDAGTIGLSLNGKSFPATSPYSLKVGESMVVHYYNEGLMSHPMHLHQPSGLVVAHDGKILDSPYWADTINVAPGERFTVVYTAKDVGVWAWHCHILTHAETPTGMKYMVTALIVK